MSRFWKKIKIFLIDFFDLLENSFILKIFEFCFDLSF